MRGFTECFGRPPTVRADAPGRVNLIGEHTDYNGGFVLPMAVPQRTIAALASRDDDRVRLASTASDGATPQTYRLGAEARRGSWVDYVQGVTAALRADGHRLGGFDLWIDSDVPVGSGVSSSAALEVAVLRALRSVFGLGLDDVQLALLGQRAENDFVGARVGVMDQMAASLADTDSALLIDTRSLVYRRIALPPGVEVLVIDSAIAHAHAGGEYNARRAECEEAAQRLGVALLRELRPADLPRLATLPAPLDRRARHVVTENARVLAAVEAIERGDLRELGRLLDASHASLRDDYEVSVPDIDRLVELLRAERGVYGARMTGGGFGGAVVALAAAGTGRGVGERVIRRYAENTGRIGVLLVPPEPAP